MGTLLLCALLLGASLPTGVSGATVTLTRFASGDTEAELTFSSSLTNGSLGITLPRNSVITGASMAVQGVLSPAGEFVTRDFSTTAVGSDLWALHEEATGIYPLTVDAYASGWEPMPSAQVANVSYADGKHWNTTTPTDPTDPPWEHPVQLYHFKIPVPVASAISYSFSWLGHGTCLGNATAPHWAEYYMYDFQDRAWDHYGGYSDAVAGRDDDIWFNTTFAGPVPIISANGSVEVAVVGPHADVDDANSTSDRGHLCTDYIGLSAKVAQGEAKYPKDVVLGVGGTDITLSTGDLEGVVVVDDARGLGQALQALLDSKPEGQGNVTLDFVFRVGALTAAKVRVYDLNVTYQAQDPTKNDPPVWMGPTSLYVEEDAAWMPALDLDATFTDDYDQGRLSFAVSSVSDPDRLATRIEKAAWGNWTLAVRPGADLHGDVDVVVGATDRLGAVGLSGTITVHVLPMPDAPVLIDPGELRIHEGAEWTLDLAAHDPDMPDDVLAFSDSSDLFDIEPATGVINWTPTSADVGAHTCVVTVTDSQGQSDSLTLRITVLNTNDRPHLTSPLRIDAVQDVPVAFRLTADDPDVALGDVLTYSAFSADLLFRLDPSTGLLSFTPANADVGTHTVIVRVQDVSGDRDEATLVVEVANVNDPPVLAQGGNLAFDQGERVSVRLVFDDPDLAIDLAVPESLAFSTAGPDFLRADAGGWVNFTADQSMVGAHTAMYTVTDLGGLSSTATVVWEIADLNDVPVITTVVEGTYIADEDAPFSLGLAAMDVDGDALAWSDDSTLFAIDPSTGAIAFTPRQSHVGTHAVTVTVSDGKGGSASASFDLVVRNMNDAPVIGSVEPADGASFAKGSQVRLSAVASDEDGDALSYSWKEGGAALGSGTPLLAGALAPGRHTITLEVSDGIATVSRTFDIVVEATGDDGGGGGSPVGLGPVLILVTVAVAVLVAVLLLRSRRGGSREAAQGPPQAERPTQSIEVEQRGT